MVLFVSFYCISSQMTENGNFLNETMFLVILKTLINWFRCLTRAKMCWKMALKEQDWTPMIIHVLQKSRNVIFMLSLFN